MIYAAIGLVWGAAGYFAVDAEAGAVAFILAGGYLVIGAGLPAAAALLQWPELSDGRLSRLLTGFLFAIVISFAASALGGQPLIWTSNWTPARHTLASTAASLIITLLVLARRPVQSVQTTAA